MTILYCRVEPNNAFASRSYAAAAGAAATATADAAVSDGPAIVTPFPLDDKPPAAATPPRPPLLQDALIWVDLEMTGLDLRTDSVIEIAVIVTDAQLREEIAVSAKHTSTDTQRSGIV